MINTILAISEFATKLVAGLSGAFFGTLFLVIAVRAKNKKTKNINTDELKRKAKEHPVEEDKKSKKNKKSKDKADKNNKAKQESASDSSAQSSNDTTQSADNAAQDGKASEQDSSSTPNA